MHFVMTCEGLYPPTTVSEMPNFPSGPWFTGQPLGYPVQEPLHYVIDPKRKGKLMPMYRCAYPLFRDDLLDVMRSTGVDNLETFDTVVADRQRKTEHTNFRAVNVLGCVAMADLSASRMHGHRPLRLIATDFASLTIDHTVAPDIMICRLAESVGAIVVHDRVRTAIEAAGIEGMTFYEDGEWGTL